MAKNISSYTTHSAASSARRRGERGLDGGDVMKAKADMLRRLEVQGCPSTPDWQLGRNNSDGNNYKYLGGVRDCVSELNPSPPFERFPVKHLRSPTTVIAFSDCDGRGWQLEWDAEQPVGDHNPLRLGN